jgi:hypothetical protein
VLKIFRLKSFHVEEFVDNKMNKCILKINDHTKIISNLAVKGASKTISKYSPKLSFAAIHEWNEVFVIPFLILEINPVYKLYLRHTAFLICETEAFAIK